MKCEVAEVPQNCTGVKCFNTSTYLLAITAVIESICNILFSPLREFLAMVGSEKARSTNMNCEVISMVKHDNSEPVVDVTYGKYYLTAFKCVREDI